MLPVLQPAQLGRELAACTILGAAVGVVRAFFPVRGRGAFVPDALLTGAVLFGVQSYAAALSSAGVLRWYMVLAAFAAALCTAAVLTDKCFHSLILTTYNPTLPVITEKKHLNTTQKTLAQALLVEVFQ